MAVRLALIDLAKRDQHISALIAPLVADSRKVQIRRFGGLRNYVVGAVPYGQSPDLVSDPASLRIPTVQSGSFFNYHEIWLPVLGKDTYDLNRAYLHIYLKRSAAEPELQALSLHCDPTLPKGEPSYIYKRGPHLHVGGAVPNIDRAHISLCIGDSAAGGNNVGSLMANFKRSIDMITSEVLPCY
jgi:hypothetical protein